MLRIFSLIPLLTAAVLGAQPDSTSSSPAPVIQDNSFLVEEAYNQEAGVVQHILTFQAVRGSKDFEIGFGQEWPVGSIRHQLSYDVGVSRIASRTGPGDAGINYRYQLTGDGQSRLAVSPRISLLIPSGDWKRGRGNGALGAEVNLPVSLVLTPLLVTHFNVGASTVPSARNVAGDRATIGGWSVGQSLIVTASPVFQPMLEVVYSRGGEVVGADLTSRNEEFLVSPGFRAAINFASGLQIVPGVAVPLGVGASGGERGVFVYLSVEHAFSR